MNNLAKSQGRTEPEPNVYPRVLSELIAYSVESSLHVEEPVIFCLPDICQLYQQRLEQLSVESPHVNSMGLKDSVLAEIPDLEAYRSDKDGREVTLALSKDVVKALSLSSDLSEALIIAKATKILRQLTGLLDCQCTQSQEL